MPDPIEKAATAVERRAKFYQDAYNDLHRRVKRSLDLLETVTVEPEDEPLVTDLENLLRGRSG